MLYWKLFNTQKQIAAMRDHIQIQNESVLQLVYGNAVYLSHLVRKVICIYVHDAPWLTAINGSFPNLRIHLKSRNTYDLSYILIYRTCPLSNHGWY